MVGSELPADAPPAYGLQCGQLYKATNVASAIFGVCRQDLEATQRPQLFAAIRRLRLRCIVADGKLVHASVGVEHRESVDIAGRACSISAVLRSKEF